MEDLLAENRTDANNKKKPSFEDIPVGKLVPGKYQPRRLFPEESLQELAETINSVGIIEPLVVRPILGDKYEIVAGERRWRAAQIAGLKTVPCLAKNYSDAQAAQIALIENISREDLDSISEANAVQKIIEEFSYNHEVIGAILGKSRSKITNLLRLLTLDKRVQHLLQTRELSEAHGKILVGVPLAQQYPLAIESFKHGWSSRTLTAKIKKLSDDKTLAKNGSKKDVNTLRLEQKLSDKLGYSVKIAFNDNKTGELKVSFNDLEQLDGILKKIGYEE